MLKKHVKLLLLVVASIVYTGCAEDPYEWAKDSIQAYNCEITDITMNSAKVSFDLRTGSGLTIESLWIECLYENKIKAKVDVTPVINGRCEALVSNLSKNTGYDVKIYAKTKRNTESEPSVGLVTNRSLYIKTLNPQDLMPVPSNITLTPNSTNSNISASCQLTLHDADLPIIEAGFFYGENATTTYENGTRVRGEISNANLVATISDLNIDTPYYIGAYVTTTIGTLTVGPQSVTTGGFYLKMYVSELTANNKGFNFILELSGIPENAELNNIIINAARPAWLDLYGLREYDWNLSELGISYTKKEGSTNTYIYDLKGHNLTAINMQSRTEYYFWFTVEWTDIKGKKHTTGMDRQPSWKVTTL